MNLNRIRAFEERYARRVAAGKELVTYACPKCGAGLFDVVPNRVQEPFTTLACCPYCEQVHHRFVWSGGAVEIALDIGGPHEPATTGVPFGPPGGRGIGNPVHMNSMPKLFVNDQGMTSVSGTTTYVVTDMTSGLERVLPGVIDSGDSAATCLRMMDESLRAVGQRVRCVTTDQARCFLSSAFAEACQELGVAHVVAMPDRAGTAREEVSQ